MDPLRIPDPIPLIRTPYTTKHAHSHHIKRKLHLTSHLNSEFHNSRFHEVLFYAGTFWGLIGPNEWLLRIHATYVFYIHNIIKRHNPVGF